MIVVRKRGEERTFTSSQTRSFLVHERQSIEMAPGDRLLLTGNRRDPGFRATNGELVSDCARNLKLSGSFWKNRPTPTNYRPGVIICPSTLT
jgi:hypothetical protein